jgi:hypothetical protein
MSDCVILLATIFPTLITALKELFIVTESNIDWIFYCLAIQICFYFFNIIILIWSLISFIVQNIPIHIVNFLFIFIVNIVLFSMNIYSFYILVQKNNLQSTALEFQKTMIYITILICLIFGTVTFVMLKMPSINTFIKQHVKTYANITFNDNLTQHIQKEISAQKLLD